MVLKSGASAARAEASEWTRGGVPRWSILLFTARRSRNNAIEYDDDDDDDDGGDSTTRLPLRRLRNDDDDDAMRFR